MLPHGVTFEMIILLHLFECIVLVLAKFTKITFPHISIECADLWYEISFFWSINRFESIIWNLQHALNSITGKKVTMLIFIVIVIFT